MRADWNAPLCSIQSSAPREEQPCRDSGLIPCNLALDHSTGLLRFPKNTKDYKNEKQKR
jgi:hypothetical protein